MRNVALHHAPPQRQQQHPSTGVRIVSMSGDQRANTLMWLVTDPQNTRRYFTVTQAAETLHCACQEGQAHPTACPHLSAVQAWLNTHRQQGHNSHSSVKRETGKQPLSWSDDKAFSIWKS